MSLQFYKPNAKSTGTACSFWRNSEDNTFWVSLIKQDSWNSKTKTGSFSKNKDNPKKRAIVKFSDLEVAGFIDAIEVDIQPDDADWDAGDIRYNVLRWTSSPNPPFGGYGPSFSNPRTGEIIYVPKRNKIRFRASKRLKEIINK